MRDSVLEYDNFETLSYQVAGLIKDKEVKKDINIDVVEETAPSEQIKHDVIDLTAADGFFVNIPNRIEECRKIWGFIWKTRWFWRKYISRIL